MALAVNAHACTYYCCASSLYSIHPSNCENGYPITRHCTATNHLPNRRSITYLPFPSRCRTTLNHSVRDSVRQNNTIPLEPREPKKTHFYCFRNTICLLFIVLQLYKVGLCSCSVISMCVCVFQVDSIARKIILKRTPTGIS